MASLAVTPDSRAFGWNVIFYHGHLPRKFAGVFQAEGSDFETFRDVVDEMRLCFEFQDTDLVTPDPIAHQANAATDGDISTDHWDKIEFALMGGLDQYQSQGLSKRTPIIHLCRAFHGLVPIRRTSSHQCAKHLSEPIRRNDTRYLPINKSSRNPRIASMPLRKKAGPKRTALTATSGAQSSNFLAPDDARLSQDYITQRMSGFRDNCCLRGSSCAAQYHLYPTDPDLEVNRGPPDLSLSNLLRALERTWSADNGIMLMKHLHYFFDLRLFSIHPDTHRIRCFVPYSPITKYNGEKAQLHGDVDQCALQHHYDMCCIENMGARVRYTSESGATTAFTYASEIPTPVSECGSPSGVFSHQIKRPRVDLGPSEAAGQQTTENQEPLDEGDDMACQNGIIGYLTSENSCDALEYIDRHLKEYRSQASG
ncbi:hypothetical protein FPRO04_13270 [Fusarium proliferatum]|nr:hypothetical protein FPRO04_13270 [Fusarium proliferatum]